MFFSIFMALLTPGNAYCADNTCYEVNEYCNGSECHTEVDTWHPSPLERDGFTCKAPVASSVGGSVRYCER